LYQVFIGIYGNYVFQHRGSPFVQIHLMIFNSVEKRTCFGRYFIETEVLTYDMLVIKLFSFALKHYAICSGIILVFNINSKIQFKEILSLASNIS
jgi:hypothetical protein